MILGKLFRQEKYSLKHVLALFSFIFVIWAVYRYFPEIMPLWMEELFLKPVIWLLPTLWVVLKVEKQKIASLGLTKKNLYPSLYWGIGLGMVFALEGFLANSLKYGGLDLVEINYTPLSFLFVIFLSFATAFSEELVFRGYIFSRFWKIFDKEWQANLFSSLLFVLIHLPIGVFVLGYTPVAMLAYLFFIFVFGLGSAFVFARTGNLISSILLHVLWSWPIILFR